MLLRSAFSFVACLTLATLGGKSLAGQSTPGTPDPSSFRASSTTTPMPQPTGPAGTLVSPETRGDIFMARKMYREAIEEYKEAPSNSAIILNKTGIAYHQMLDMAAAKKYYQL